jgi:hypothetical protein
VRCRCAGPFHNVYELVYVRRVAVTSSYFPLPTDRSVVSLTRTLSIWEAINDLMLMHHRLPILIDADNLIFKATFLKAWEGLYTALPVTLGLTRKVTVQVYI